MVSVKQKDVHNQNTLTFKIQTTYWCFVQSTQVLSFMLCLLWTLPTFYLAHIYLWHVPPIASAFTDKGSCSYNSGKRPLHSLWSVLLPSSRIHLCALVLQTFSMKDACFCWIFVVWFFFLYIWVHWLHNHWQKHVVFKEGGLGQCFPCLCTNLLTMSQPWPATPDHVLYISTQTQS